MQIHADMRRQSEIDEEHCLVTDIIELSEREYASLYQNLFRERGFFAKRSDMESFIDGQRCCVLVLGEDQEDGILLDTQGRTTAYLSSFIPNARTIVKNHIRHLADYIVSEGTEHTEDGKWSNTYDELYYHFGASITDTNGNGKLLLEELQQREETTEVIMTEDCIEIAYHLQYCQNCGDKPWDVLSLVGCNIQDEHFDDAPSHSFALDEFSRRMTGIVDQFAADAVKKQLEGEYKTPLSVIRNAAVNAPFCDELFMEMLYEREEIAEVDYDCETDELSVALSPEFVRYTEETGMRELSKQDLDIMCAKHTLWLNDAGGEQADFSGCIIRGMDLSQKNLNNAVFDGAKIVNTNLYRSELCFASFVGAKIYNCYASDMIAEEASFKDAEIICTKMMRGIFTHSNFTEARMLNTDLYSSSMNYCCLEGVSFEESNTSDVRMERCSYDEAEWTSEQESTDDVIQTM